MQLFTMDVLGDVEPIGNGGSIDFGSTSAGTPLTDMVIVANSGTADLAISGIAACDPTTCDPTLSEFTDSDAPTVVPAGTTAEFQRPTWRAPPPTELRER